MKKVDWTGSQVTSLPMSSRPRTLRAIDAMVFGKTAHATIAEFWKTADKQEQTPELPEQARLMRILPKYVLTHGSPCVEWENSHPIRLDDLARIKREAERPVALFAGAAAVRAALAAGVVDELRTIRYPVLLGAGKPLFDGKGKRHELTLIEDRRFDFRRNAVAVSSDRREP